MQETNGAVLGKVSVTGHQSAAPPSTDNSPRYYGPVSTEATAIAGGPGDLSGGVPNLLRYAFGGIASTPPADLLPQFVAQTVEGNRVLRVTIPRIPDSRLTYVLQTSHNLVDWLEPAHWSGPAVGTPAVVDIPVNGAPVFFRVGVTRD